MSDIVTAFWKNVGALCTTILPPGYVQCRIEDAVCRSEGADEEHRRGREGH